MGELTFTVIGVFRERVATFGLSEIQKESVIIPLGLMKYYTGEDVLRVLYAQAVSPETVASVPAPEETAVEADPAAARRRSTVREKVSFMSSAQAEPAPTVSHSAPEPMTAPAPEPAPETTSEAPRKAGWWSRRFGNGE